MGFPYSSGDVLTAADLNANIDGTAQFVGRNTGSGASYPASVTSSGQWVVPVAVNVTCNINDQFFVQFEASWVNTATNIISFSVYDSGTAAGLQITQGRFNSGNNFAAASVVWTAPSSGSRALQLRFASSAGSMQAFGSENVTNLIVWKIQ